MLKELKGFLLRGDVVTLAVAVIIGGAFGKIVDSLVGDLISPILSFLTGGVNFQDSMVFGADAEGKGGFRLGAFIQAVINFLLVGISLFFVIKAAGKNSEDVK
jgi:large conductance mechanosensitive channel